MAMPYRMLQKVLQLILLPSLLLLLRLHETRGSLAKPGCQEKCGNMTVIYPFGIGQGCYRDKPFEVTCEPSNNFPLPRSSTNGLQISGMSLDSIRIIAVWPNFGVNCLEYGGISWDVSPLELDQRFSYSHTHNKLIGMGCNIFAYITGHVSTTELSGCVALCNSTNPVVKLSASTSCSGINGCCQAAIPESIRSVDLGIASISMFNESRTSRPCSIAFIAENDFSGFTFNTSHQSLEVLICPVVLNWVIDNTTCHDALQRDSYACYNNSYCTNSSFGIGYKCNCLEGYQGNPYLLDGCKDAGPTSSAVGYIDECDQASVNTCPMGYRCVNTPGSYHCTCPPGYISDGKGSDQHGCSREKDRSRRVLIFGTATAAGLLMLSAFGDWIYRKLQRRKKAMFFKRNGGLLLQKQISFGKGNEMKLKLYATEQMENATENFKRSRVLGQGGHGTVYKGMLSDGCIVAIKKSNVVDEDQVSHFINEVFILSQINHRNVVKLLGCCLEYEVPLLVYEYVSNGTLARHIHNEEQVSTLAWETRLQIADDVAGALAYLHSYASITIFHRDVKSGNILLDENYRAVVSDFGLSKSVSLTKTHLTTMVGGTFGYLDPEYFRSGKLTDKSDVFAFGVVLAELLTGRKAVSLRSSDEGLALHFQYSMKQKCLFETLDTLVVNEAREEEIVAVAKLAKRCLKMNAKRRPSMKEVVADLDRLRRLHSRIQLPSKRSDNNYCEAIKAMT